MKQISLNEERAISWLMSFLAVEGITGQEKAIGQQIVKSLLDAGVPRKAIRFDDAHQRIPLPTQTGNLIVQLPGNRPGPRRLFMTHMDTVPLCAKAVPVRKGNRIVPGGRTALGGDNRTGCACLVSLLATIVEHDLPHPPLTVLFTVREESGLWGARFVDLKDVGEPALGFNIDGRSPREITLGAVGAERWEVEILGKAAHAGAYPQRGISATMIASLALAEIHREGWFGKIRRDGKEGTSNVGVFGGGEGRSAGEATNVVTDYVYLHGESRSHDRKFVRAITTAYRDALCRAASHVVDDRGRRGKVRFKARLDYHPFRLKDNSPVVQHAVAAARVAGWDATLRTTNGGLDANWLVRHGVPTITFGAGQNNIHTIEEYVDVPEFLESCRYAVALATT